MKNNLLMKHYLGMGKKPSGGGELPSGYTQVINLCNPNSAFIDTAYKPNSRCRIEFDFYVGNTEHNSVPMGWRWTGGSGGNQQCYMQDVGEKNKNIHVGYFDSTKNLWNSNAENKIIIDFINKKKISNGVNFSNPNEDNWTTPFADNGVSPQSIYLFALNSIGNAVAIADSYKLKSFKVYEENNLVVDMIPCIAPDGVVGVYDLVRRRFFGSSNDKVFTYDKYIQFEDPEVAKICVQNFSSDGIGVTYEDAEKVERMRALFQDNKSIKTFNELKYFTNLKITDNTFTRSTIERVTFSTNFKNLGPFIFNGATNIKDFTDIIGLENIESMSDSPFGSSSIGGILYMPNLKNLSRGAFKGCKITEIKDLGQVKKIEDSAFSINSELVKVNLSDKISEIADEAFRYCNALSIVVIKAINPPILYNKSLPPNVKKIYAPDTSVEAYKTAPNWSKYADKIKPLSTYVEPTN